MTNPEPTEPGPPRPRRRLRWLLIGSLALNLLLIGLFAGGAVRMWRGVPQAVSAQASAPSLLWRALPDEDRRSLRSDMRIGGERQAVLRRDPWRAQIAAEIAELRALLTAESFDRAALEGRLTVAREQQAERAEAAQTRMMERIEAMDATTRAEMAARLERRLLRRDDRPRHD